MDFQLLNKGKPRELCLEYCLNGVPRYQRPLKVTSQLRYVTIIHD